MRPRDTKIDILRIMACLLVVVMHSPMPTTDANGPFLGIVSYLAAPCIGLFFMVSGSLLMPVKTDYFTFIRRRLGKILIPTLVWTFIYVGLNVYFSQSEINILRTLFTIPFAPQGTGVLWFIYALTGLYLLAPILSAWAEKASERELRMVLALWGVTLCYPILKLWIGIETSTSGILYYFTGYGGYFLLGYYLRRFPRGIPLWLAASISAAGAGLLFVLWATGTSYDFYSLFWYQSIFIASQVVVIALIVRRLPDCGAKAAKVLAVLADLTFGVYLCHILIMRKWLWNVGYITDMSNYIAQTLLIITLSIALSFGLSVLLSRLPFGKYLTGYRLK